MFWIFTSLATYFLWAITNVVDKSLLAKKFSSAFSYAVLGGTILFIETLFLIPFFGISVPRFTTLIILLLGGVSFIYALVLYIKALSFGNASTIVPLTSLTAIFTFIFSWLLFGEKLAQGQLTAFVLLLIGGLFISLERTPEKNVNQNLTKAIILVLLSNAIFGLSYSLQGYILSSEPFWNSFVWMRIFGFLATLSLLLVPSVRAQTNHFLQTSTFATKSLFTINQVIAFIAFLLLSYSFSIANTSLVNALQGAQYVFLFIFIIILGRYLPNIFKESTNKKTLLNKIIGIALIVLGIVVLSV